MSTDERKKQLINDAEALGYVVMPSEAYDEWCARLGDPALARPTPQVKHEMQGGYVLVPTEPTAEMLIAGNDGIDDDIDSWNHDSDSGYIVEPQAAYNVWKRMINAVPTVTRKG